MAKRQNVKTQSPRVVPEAPPPAAPPAGGGHRTRRRLEAVGLGLLTAALLNLSFAPADMWFLGFAALVPWTLALVVAPTRRWALLSATGTGFVFWAAILYWLTWITPGGYLAGIAYLSLYWLIAAAILRAAIRRNQPMWIVLPLVWVSLEFVRGNAQALCLGPTFPWFALAYSQYARTTLIQIADVTGIYGVSFFVAMVNGLLIDLALRYLARGSIASELGRGATDAGAWRRRVLQGALAVGVTAAGLLGYGAWQLSRDTRRAGPVVGIVQQAYPISLAGRNATAEEILDAHLAATKAFLASKVKPDLVIWPETMLPRGLNRDVLDANVQALKGDALRALASKFFGSDAWNPKYDEPTLRSYLQPYIYGGRMPSGDLEPGRAAQAGKILAMCRLLGCPILAGGTTLHANDTPLFPDDRWLVRNGAIWFDPNEPNAPTYAKRHLVPFSEYVPFKHTWLGLYKLLRTCVPDVMEQLDPGPENTRFALRRPGGSWRVIAPICYEGTMPSLCRRMVYEDGRKRADVMANLSNDGWFVYRWPDDTPRASTEQAEHLSHYCFRAVESRVPVVRAVNTGISGSIDSNGRIVAEVRRDGRNTMVVGTLLLDGARDGGGDYLPGHGPKVLVDGRTSWYSRVGDAFAWAVGLATAAWMVGLLLWSGRKKEGLGN